MDHELNVKTRTWLVERGVRIDDIADLVYDLQKPFVPDLPREECARNVERVLEKRETQNAILTGIQLDLLAEQGALEEPLQSIIANDAGLYGIDEALALAILHLYGSISLTSFGYLDKTKPGIIGVLNRHKGGRVHTFLDDLVAAVAAAASSRIAHRLLDPIAAARPKETG
ncbi:MAG TPA: phosphatidylglycerophosphatase A [Calditerricola sp.]